MHCPIYIAFTKQVRNRSDISFLGSLKKTRRGKEGEITETSIWKLSQNTLENEFLGKGKLQNSRKRKAIKVEVHKSNPTH